MATSDQKGRILFPTTDFDADSPHGSLLARVMVNNALHFADQDAQVRVCASDLSLTTDTLTTTTEWSLITVAGPFPVRMAATGSLYSMRIRMGGVRGGQSAVVKMRACVSSPRTMQEEMLAAGTNVLEVSTISTSSAWLTATTGAQGTTVLTFSDQTVNDAFWPAVSTVDPSGDPVSVEMVQMVCSVWGQAANVATTPTLTGLYLAEFL